VEVNLPGKREELRLPVIYTQKYSGENAMSGGKASKPQIGRAYFKTRFQLSEFTQ